MSRLERSLIIPPRPDYACEYSPLRQLYRSSWDHSFHECHSALLINSSTMYRMGLRGLGALLIMMNCPTGVSDSILPTAIGYCYFAPVNFFCSERTIKTLSSGEKIGCFLIYCEVLGGGPSCIVWSKRQWRTV